MNAKIFQIYYQAEQQGQLDPAFIPYNNLANPHPEWVEYWVFLDNYLRGKIAENELTGFVSWKFAAKTRLAGQTFLQFIADNPGYDVYYVNPFPHLAYQFQSVWHQADFNYPGVLDFFQGILARKNIALDLQTLTHSPQETLYCNFWAARQSFWETYIEFTRPLYDCLKQDLTVTEKTFVRRRPDKASQPTFLPYLQERWFSTFLAVFPGKFKTLAYAYSRAELAALYPSPEDEYLWRVQQIHAGGAPDDEQAAANAAFFQLWLSRAKIQRDAQRAARESGVKRDLRKIYLRQLSRWQKFALRHPPLYKTIKGLKNQFKV